jgi:toxin YoeB
MEIRPLPKFERQYRGWLKVNPGVCARIDALVADVVAHPFTGLGMPEKLKGSKGDYSRRIVGKHRLIYRVEKQAKAISLVSCHGHYEDYRPQA